MQLLVNPTSVPYAPWGRNIIQGAKRRAALYAKCLDIVEQRMEAGLIINAAILAQILKVNDVTTHRILAENFPLRRIIFRYQRLIGQCQS